MVGRELEQNEKAEAALEQLTICARADCDKCTVEPRPASDEFTTTCRQVSETCERILRESLGLPEEEGAEDGKTTE